MFNFNFDHEIFIGADLFYLVKLAATVLFETVPQTTIDESFLLFLCPSKKESTNFERNSNVSDNSGK